MDWISKNLEAFKNGETLSFQLSTTQKTAIAGGVGGCLGKTCTAPLSRITILYQVNNSMCSSSLLSTFWKILRTEGLSSFWKGNLTSVIHRFPYSGINFATYEHARKIVHDKMKFQESLAMKLLCGAISGTAACVGCYPLDVARTRFIASTASSSTRPHHIVTLLADIWRNEGILGLYRGMGMSLFVSVPNIAISFAVYGSMKEQFIISEDVELFIDPVSGSLTFLGSLLSGSVSGFLTSVITFPVDVIRRRLQLPGTVRAGAVAELREILQAGGVRRLYRGLLPELLKVVPMVGVTFCAYENIQKILNKSQHTSS